jgi:hypothetical protein
MEMNINPTPIPCDTAGRAVEVLELAREHCLSASYHPNGGETARRNHPVTHTVWVTGARINFRAFRMALTQRSSAS